ncbi:unnamed protein product [Fraxinus pennsylvanica]|uniref:Uncharacterized protein n=1 Tax=Fraxinus pennsylvanica TaxID=56036 RepID=A0AAD2DVY0_9LAMI|nr:unnamed protein product [Fraxinus pennsylvanica]
MEQWMGNQSQSEGGINEEDNAIKQSEGTICETPDRIYGRKGQNFQQDLATIRRSGSLSILASGNMDEPFVNLSISEKQPLHVVIVRTEEDRNLGCFWHTYIQLMGAATLQKYVDS